MREQHEAIISTTLLPVNTRGDIQHARSSIFVALEKVFPRVSDRIVGDVKHGEELLNCLVNNLAISSIANDELDKRLMETVQELDEIQSEYILVDHDDEQEIKDLLEKLMEDEELEDEDDTIYGNMGTE